MSIDSARDTFGGTRGATRRPCKGSGALALALTVVLAACAAPPAKAPVAAPAPISLQDYLQQAALATTEGSRETAREAWRNAAKAYPASKQPWSKLSEDYLAAGDYGNAILAAQEVLSRDATDSGATVVLAMSGLRLSATTLPKLRAQSRIAGEARTDAESLTVTLREVLADDAPAQRPASGNAAAKRRAAPRPAAAAKVADGTAAGNPFDKLK